MMKFFSWYERSFANKIIAQTLLVGFVAALFLATTSLYVSYAIVANQEESLREKDLIIARNSLESRLNNLLLELIDLSQDSDVVEGMSDGSDPAIYFQSVIRSIKFQDLTRYGLTLQNKAGQKVFSSRDDSWLAKNHLLEFQSHSDDRVIQIQSDQNGALRARIERIGGAQLLLMSADIISSKNRQNLGSVTLELPILDLLSYTGASGGDPREWELSNVADATLPAYSLLKVKPPLNQLNLSLKFKEVNASALGVIKILVPSFTALILSALFLSWLLSRSIATNLAGPILAIAKSARNVIEHGRVDLEAPQSLQALPKFHSSDEVGQLLRDESSMLETLHALQNNLESLVQHRSAMLAAIFELSPDGYLEVDEAGSINFVNPTFISMMGFAALDLRNFTWQELRDLLNDRLGVGEEKFDDSFFVQRILRFNTPSLRTFMVSMRVTSEKARILYWRDLTGEIETEEMKKAFFAKIAHELRTPMTSILGFSQLLHQAPDISSAHKDSLDIIIRQANNLLNLINDLLDLARLENKQSRQLQYAYHSISALTRLVLADFKMPHDQRDLQIFLDEHLPEVFVDRMQYRQVLVNILSNACKYSPAGSPIEVRTCRSKGSDSSWIGIQIKDHGIGMDVNQISQLGTPFYRANPETEVLGTGLGISVVREIMAQHGGTVEFISTPNVGTTVNLWFPARPQLDPS